jgi:hypothetical protein
MFSFIFHAINWMLTPLMYTFSGLLFLYHFQTFKTKESYLHIYRMGTESCPKCKNSSIYGWWWILGIPSSQMWHHIVQLKFISILDEHNASIFSKPSKQQASLVDFYWTICHQTPEDSTLHSQHCEASCLT